MTSSPPVRSSSSRSFASRRVRRSRKMLQAAAVAVVAALVLWRYFETPRTLTRWHTKGQFAAISATDRYDVLVVGGTPSGIAAALAAGRRGARVLLVDPHPHLGGDVVYAMLNQFDVPIRPGQATPVHGIFAEFFDQLGIAFSIDEAQRLFESTVQANPNIEVMMRTRAVQALKNESKVVGAVLKSAPDSTLGAAFGEATTPKEKQREVLATVVVDATNDADFAARAGAGYYVGREIANRDKKMQSAGLLFSVSGVNWGQVKDYVRDKRRMRRSDIHQHLKKSTIKTLPVQSAPQKSASITPASWTVPTAFQASVQSPFEYSMSGAKAFRLAALPDMDHPRGPRIDTRKSGQSLPLAWLRLGGAHGNYAWERGDIVKMYHPRGKDILCLSINFGRQNDGNVVLNTVNILNVNGLDAKSMQHARREAMQELPFFMAHLRRAMPGFAHAKLKQVAPELYIRETRHIHGFYSIKAEDVRAQTRFYDRVALASYPLDLHPYTKDQINPYGPRRYYYALPLRSLVPRAVDGVLVASRSLSATYSAAGSCRVIPITMAAGEAAGAAAWLCATKGVSPHQILGNDPAYLRQLQSNLREGGADIGDDIPQLVLQSAILRTKHRAFQRRTALH